MSKKIIFFSIVSAGLMFSCQKTTIQPVNETAEAENAPVWRNSVSTGNQTENQGVTGSQSKDFTFEGILITDPNNDEDRNKKRKGNN